MTAKFRSIQLIRAAAAVGVLLCHTAGWPLGAAGVDLFFVISGFIIGTIMPGRDARTFLADRLRRIYPIYLVSLIPWAIVGAWFATIPADRLAVSLTLWPLWSGNFLSPINPPAWSLSFEMLFYLVAAASIAAGRRWLPYVVFTVTAILFQVMPGPVLGFIGNPLVLEFCAGLLLTQLPRRASVAAAAIPAGLLIFAMSPSAILFEQELAIHDIGSPMRLLWWGCPALLLSYGALTFEKTFAGRGWNGGVLVGDASYSIYLIHVLPALILPWWWPVETVIIVAMGIAVHLAVEKPLLNRLRRPKFSPDPTRAPATAPAT